MLHRNINKYMYKLRSQMDVFVFYLFMILFPAHDSQIVTIVDNWFHVALIYVHIKLSSNENIHESYDRVYEETMH